MRMYLNIEAAYKIFEMVILPLLLYSSLINLQLSTTQRRRLCSIERRAKQIIGGTKKVGSIEKLMKKKACKIVKKCLDDEVCTQFKGYFKINHHSRTTRNSNTLMKLPKVKLEFFRKSFKFQGAKIFNDLPLSIRSSQNNFYSLMSRYFT